MSKANKYLKHQIRNVHAHTHPRRQTELGTVTRRVLQSQQTIIEGVLLILKRKIFHTKSKMMIYLESAAKS